MPGIGLPEASLRVTVMVEVAAPLSATEVGLATTVEFDFETGPGKVTEAVLVKLTPPVTARRCRSRSQRSCRWR